MKNVVDFQDSSSIRDEAIAWMSRLDSDVELSAEEHAQLREWLDRSNAHRKWMHDLADMWGQLNILTELAVPLSHESVAERPSTGRTTRAWQFAAAAAVLVIVIAAGSVNWKRDLSAPDSNGQYTTAIGEQQSRQLSDGSVLLLNTNSEVRVQFSSTSRDVYLLQGEAHFTVAKSSDRPFRVFAGNGRIAALGTAFSVRLKEQEVDVTVTEGRVALASMWPLPDAHTGDAAQSSRVVKELGTLKGGQIASIVNIDGDDPEAHHALGNLRDLELQDLSRRMSWTEGSLVYSGEPLKEVVKEIGRYTTVTIEFADPALGEIPVGGLYPVSETDYFFKTLETSFGLNVTYQSPSHVIVSSGAK